MLKPSNLSTVLERHEANAFEPQAPYPILSILEQSPILGRVDAATAIAPEALVGRQIRVYWPEDDAWYLGTVGHYDPAAHTHQVRAQGPGFKGSGLSAHGCTGRKMTPGTCAPWGPMTTAHTRTR